MRIALRTILLLFTLAPLSSVGARESTQVLPKVVAHSEVVYPPLARQARIQGDVRVRMTTDGESVNAVEAETGNPMLRKGAEDNVRTWRFAAHTPGTFYVTFRYKLFSGNVDVEFLESQGLVQIGAPPPELIIDYAYLGLGTWKAEFKSAYGAFSEIFELRYSGPKGEWLAGNGLGPKGDLEEIDFGHKEGDFLAFTVALPRMNGKRVKAFLVGKMTGDRIVGTFVNEAGVRGEWTAVRVK